MEKINWTEHKNEAVLAIIQEKRALIQTIRKRQRKVIGHVLRGDSLLRTVIEGKWRERRKTKTDDAELDDGGRLWSVERRGPTSRGVAAL